MFHILSNQYPEELMLIAASGLASGLELRRGHHDLLWGAPVVPQQDPNGQ